MQIPIIYKEKEEERGGLQEARHRPEPDRRLVCSPFLG